MNLQVIHKYFHWYYYTQKKHLLFNLGTALFLWLFLAISQPFGIYNNNVSPLELFLFLLPIGLLWIIIVYAIDALLAKLKSNPRKLVSKDFYWWIIKIVIFIQLLWILRGIFSNWNGLNLKEYVELCFAMFLLIGLCYLPYSLYAKSKYYHSVFIKEQQEPSAFLIKGAGNEVLNIDPEQIIYAKANDNYVEIFIANGEQHVKKLILRSSLSAFAQQLSSKPSIIRSHRSYLLNSRYFKAYHRTNKKVELKGGGELFKIPVSKTYKALVDELFIHPK